MGFYSVAVSNLNGVTISVPAALNPAAGSFQPPVLSGGRALAACPANFRRASSVASNRASRGPAHIHDEPFATVQQLDPGPPTRVTFSNGLLRVDGLIATSPASQFFRAQGNAVTRLCVTAPSGFRRIFGAWGVGS